MCGLLLFGCFWQDIFHDFYICAEHLIENHKTITSCKDTYLKEDGFLPLVFTKTQRKKWLDTGQSEEILILTAWNRQMP